MITVRDAVAVLKSANKIVLGYGSNAVSFDKDDPLVVDAYGSYMVDDIKGYNEGYYEINIVMRPVRVGDC